MFVIESEGSNEWFVHKEEGELKVPNLLSEIVSFYQVPLKLDARLICNPIKVLADLMIRR